MHPSGCPDYELVAQVTKARGLNGEVVVVPTSGLPFLLYEGLEVDVVPPTLDGVRHTTVSAVRELAKGWGVMLDGVDAPAASSELPGRYLLAKVDDLPSDVEYPGSPEFIGFEVVSDEYGPLGTVVATTDNGEYETLVVEGPYGEVLVPAVDEFIVAVDEDAITVTLPAGLVELAG
jgi:16S rRNA processing protein RimM